MLELLRLIALLEFTFSVWNKLSLFERLWQNLSAKYREEEGKKFKSKILLYLSQVTVVSLAVPVAARLLRLWVRIQQGAWMFVCCECCVLSGRGLCDELSSCPEQSYGCLSVVSVVCCQVEVSASS